MKNNPGIIALIVLIGFSVSVCNQQNNRQADRPDDNPYGNNGKVTRFGSVIKLKPDKYDLYRDLHGNPWPELDSLLKVYNIRNYSIYYRDGYLFSYLEYTGNSWELDMTKLSDEKVIQEWWKLTDPCQEPVDSADEGEWWAPMEELYHLE